MVGWWVAAGGCDSCEGCILVDKCLWAPSRMQPSHPQSTSPPSATARARRMDCGWWIADAIHGKAACTCPRATARARCILEPAGPGEARARRRTGRMRGQAGAGRLGRGAALRSASAQPDRCLLLSCSGAEHSRHGPKVPILSAQAWF